jgi:LuxR family maltose regulon positive regulatory protein
VHKLDGILQVPLTLIAAPAGSGKTTIIAQWLQQANCAAAWFSLDERDNDTATFLRYLVAAFQTIVPHAGTTLLALLQAMQRPRTETLVTTLLNDLAQFGRDVVLVLDDYHLIQAHNVHELVHFLVEHLPPHVHIVMTSRESPPLPLNRLRARRKLLELRATQLRFTHEEIIAFLRDTMAITVSPADVDLLEARTEGWIAGLQLAALALRDQVDPARFVAAFSGSNRYIVDYLLAEVFDQLPSHLQTFVLQTSVLDRFCGPLCDAVLGITPVDSTDVIEQPAPLEAANGSYSQLLLQEIERRNLFLLPLDDEQHWYRYHPLFAEVLRHRLLSGARPDQVEQLNKRASQWCWGQSFAVEAIEYALRAKDYSQAARHITTIRWQLLDQSQSGQLLEWLKRFPEEVIPAYPLLALSYAWALFHNGKWDVIERYLGYAEAQHYTLASEQASIAQQIKGEIAAMRGSISANRGDYEQAIVLCEDALEQLPKDDARIRQIGLFNLCELLWMRDDVPASNRALQEACAIGSVSNLLYPTLFLHYYLGVQLMVTGELRAAAESAEQAMRFATSLGAERSPMIGPVYVVLGRLALERNDLAAAEYFANEAIAFCEQLGNPEARADAYMGRARLALAQGDLAQAAAHIQTGLNIANTAEINVVFVGELTATRMLIFLAQGDSRAAEATARSRQISLESPSLLREPELLALVRTLIVQGRANDTLPLLEQLLYLAQTRGRHGSEIAILIIQALVLRSSAPQRALAALGRALERAEPEGYFRTFLDEGAPMAELLGMALQRGIQPAYVQSLLAAFGAQVDSPVEQPLLPPRSVSNTPTSHQQLVEPLNTRELEVLQLIAQGRSNREIADRLIVTLSTVKWHINHLYAKLEVNTRTQAIARATELGLL